MSRRFVLRNFLATGRQDYEKILCRHEITGGTLSLSKVPEVSAASERVTQSHGFHLTEVNFISEGSPLVDSALHEPQPLVVPVNETGLSHPFCLRILLVERCMDHAFISIST